MPFAGRPGCNRLAVFAASEAGIGGAAITEYHGTESARRRGHARTQHFPSRFYTGTDRRRTAADFVTRRRR
jgi:hypothetical protein